MLIPDLRGHGKSGELPGPYDVPELTSDLDAVLEERFRRSAHKYPPLLSASLN